MRIIFRNALCVIALSLLAISGCRHASLRSMLPSLDNYSSTTDAFVEPANLRYFVNPQVVAARPNRVVMVASGRSNGNYRTHQKVISELAAQIRARGHFEIVAPPNRYLQGHSDNILTGKFEEAELASMAREFSADAVLLVKVNQFRSTPPMRASLSIAILDGNESVVSFGLDGVWDLANPDTKFSFAQFLSGVSPASGSEANLQLQSPNQLFRFIGSQVADSITNSGF